MNNKTAAIIQARMGSTRLPGKVLKDLCGKTVLEHVIERIQQAKLVDEVIIASTESEQDNPIIEQAQKSGAKHFRGSEDDVLSRYYLAARENNADIIIRITSDCPVIDPVILDEIIKFYQKNDYTIVTNAGNDLQQRTFPRGLDVEVFSFKALQKAFDNATEKYQREHVTPYIYENEDKIYYYKNDVDYSKYRWTLDTEEDFELIKAIYESLYRGKHDFYFADILKLFEQNPELSRINEHVEQKKLELEMGK